MCEIKTVLIVATLLLAVTGSCIDQVISGREVGHLSEIKSKVLAKKSTRSSV